MKYYAAIINSTPELKLENIAEGISRNRTDSSVVLPSACNLCGARLESTNMAISSMYIVGRVTYLWVMAERHLEICPWGPPKCHDPRGLQSNWENSEIAVNEEHISLKWSVLDQHALVSFSVSKALPIMKVMLVATLAFRFEQQKKKNWCSFCFVPHCIRRRWRARTASDTKLQTVGWKSIFVEFELQKNANK